MARFVAVDFVAVDFVVVDCVAVGFVASGSVAWDYSPDDCCLELTNSKPIRCVSALREAPSLSLQAHVCLWAILKI